VSQSTGHTCVLQDRAVSVSAHTAPLPTLGLSTLRVRDKMPPAHVTEHVPQLDQAATEQSTGSTVGETDGLAVGAGVGVGVGEGVGVDVGAGVGVSVGAGVGLHAQTACSMLPLHVRPTIPPVPAQIGLSPGADVDRYRRSPSAVPAQV
jgi:hypothetical protein